MIDQYLKSITGLDNRPGNVGADMGVHFICGGLAGITAASATYPLDLIRTRLSAQVKKCTSHDFRFADVFVYHPCIRLYRLYRNSVLGY